MKFLNLYEDFDWDESDFDYDEDEPTVDPYSLDFPIMGTVTEKIKDAIKLYNWPEDMYDLVGKNIIIDGIESLEVNVNNKYDEFDHYYVTKYMDLKPLRYERYIPFDCMDIIS